MKAYLAFINEEKAGFGVVFPDLPGCTTVGDSFEEAIERAGEALALYADGVLHSGHSLPPPRTLKQIEKAKLDWIEPGYVVAAIPLIAPRKQTTRVNIALDQSELDAIDDAASRSGVDRSTYMVRAALFAAGPSMMQRREAGRRFVHAAMKSRPGLAEDAAKPMRGPGESGKKPKQKPIDYARDLHDRGTMGAAIVGLANKRSK